jgi:hypothetical protein
LLLTSSGVSGMTSPNPCSSKRSHLLCGRNDNG